LVALSRVGEIKRLQPRITNLDKRIREQLLKLSASTGPVEMVQLMAEITPMSRFLLGFILEEAVRNENLDILSWAGPGSERWLSYGPKNQEHCFFGFLREALESSSEETFTVYKQAILTWCHEHKACGRRGVTPPLRLVVVWGIRGGSLQEERAINLWKELTSLGVLTRDDVESGLLEVAHSSCSLKQTKALLECWAAIEGDQSKWWMNSPLESVLKCASGFSSRRAAELMRFLLLAGAKTAQQPAASGNGVLLSSRGVRKVSKWLGMTWPELVAWAQEQRSSMKLDCMQDPYSFILDTFFSSPNRQPRATGR
jgi:hypothetical protein